MKPIEFTPAPRFETFEEALRIDLYSPVASNWFLVIVDIRNSTMAIEAGRYKEVNSVAGACVMAVLNAVGPIPFVFGGDGVTFLASPDTIDKAAHVLALTRTMARKAFQLELAVGKVPVRDLYEEGYSVGLADLSLSSAQTQSMFCGSGIAVAEAWIKSPERGPNYSINDPANPDPPASYMGLECRWNPLKASKGVSLTILANCPHPQHRAQQVYRSVANTIQTLVGGNANPVQAENLKLASRISSFFAESRIRTFGASVFFRLTYQWFHFFSPPGLPDFGSPLSPEKYVREVIGQSDFRKFDGCLRMVLDVRPEEANSITELLEKYYQQGDLAYGTHRSDHVLLTCMIFNKAKGKHFHLVDGGNGGYTLASKELKRRLASLAGKRQQTA